MVDQSGAESRAASPIVERYSQRDNPGFEAIMALRTAAKEGAFFQRHLIPGMRVLDVGCGPGSITLGFAEAVAHGEAVGVDLQKSQVTQAQALSASREIKNASFKVADAYHLPFPDGSFDGVFAHAVLWHLREPERALTEMRRVLRPGGIVGVCDCDWGGRIYAPATPLLDNWFALTVGIRKHNGGNPFFGRNLLTLLLEAGFETPHLSVAPWSAGAPEEVQLCATFLKAQLQGFSSTALAEGWMNQDEIEAVASEIETWSRRPDAFYLDTYCEALGRKCN